MQKRVTYVSDDGGLMLNCLERRSGRATADPGGH